MRILRRFLTQIFTFRLFDLGWIITTTAYTVVDTFKSQIRGYFELSIELTTKKLI
jgi:hypothetical protein